MKHDRYIRQTRLKGFGDEAQQKMTDAKVLVVGAGGLGIPVLQYLTAMGIGAIGIVENDNVDITNLQRQVIYAENDVGTPKIYAVIQTLKNLNREIQFLPFKTFLTKENALKIVEQFDVVVDASDNFATRYLINDACVILNKPFVYGALHAFEGQISVFNYKNGATYRCLFPKPPSANEIPDCNENGVLGVIPGIVGTLQALEVVKVITGIGEVLSGRLLLYDGLEQSFQKMVFAVVPENKRIKELKDDYGFALCDLDNSISALDFLDKIKAKSDFILIDVRSNSEFASGHITGARNIPVEELKADLDTFQNRGKPVYIICQSGKRSQKAIQYIKSKLPETNLVNVEGGYDSIHLSSSPKMKN